MPEDVRKAVRVIRRQISELYGQKVGKNIQVIYGGSIQPETAGDYAEMREIDGMLIGGASLSANKFSQIVEKVYKSIK